MNEIIENNSNEETRETEDEYEDNRLVIGYLFASIIVAIYFIVKAIKENYFDPICYAIFSSPYVVSNLLHAIKKRSTGKIILYALLLTGIVVGVVIRIINMI